MIYYFSGTGNSKFVAEKLAHLLNEQLYSITDDDIKADSSLGLVFPIYAWGMPSVVEQFIKKLKECKAQYVWAVMTCGDDMGFTDKLLDKALRAATPLHLNASWSVQMPNTYVCLPGFDIDDKALADAKIEKTIAKLPTIAEAIRQQQSVTDVNRGPMPYTKSYVLRAVFNATLVTDKYFHTNDDCSHCGKCVKNCPLHNITEDIKWKGNCCGCLRCYHACPKHAIEFGKFTKNKGQKAPLNSKLLTPNSKLLTPNS